MNSLVCLAIVCLTIQMVSNGPSSVSASGGLSKLKDKLTSCIHPKTHDGKKSSEKVNEPYYGKKTHTEPEYHNSQNSDNNDAVLGAIVCTVSTVP